MTSCYDQLTPVKSNYPLTKNVTISRAQVHSSSRSRVLLKLTADQGLVFDWIAGSCQVNLLKTEPGLKVNQIITVSSLQTFFFSALFCVSVL